MDNLKTHKQFPGKMDKTNKKEYKKGYKVAKHGNVKEGYGKLKHVKLFENFENDSKWFVAQDGEERFKFQAKDMDEATEYAARTWNAEVVGEVDEEMEFEDSPMDENDVNEGSYTDFLTSHGNALKSAVKKMKEIQSAYDDKIEEVGDEIEKAMEVYDDNVGPQIDSWTGDDNISTDKIAKFAIQNQDKFGTEPQMVLDAIDEFHKIIMG